MKDGNWIPVDKRLVNLLPKDKPYTYLEAYISFRCDMEDNKDFTINGYAKMWQWSRNKVRNFVEGLRTGKGHSVDTQRTGKGHEVRIVFNNLEELKNKQRTGKGQSKDKQEYTTIYPNPKPNKKPIVPSPLPEAMELSELLADFVLKHNPGNANLAAARRNKTIMSWAIDIEKMHRLDGRSWDSIRTMIRWCQGDPFWHRNILSGAKLREKYDTMYPKSQAAKVAQGGIPDDVQRRFLEGN